ncbi:MAG: response regulator [Candidatus Eisenbacteria sp.]|nr:response regulator [Candidatus Eisenbacteria bacterium]
MSDNNKCKILVVDDERYILHILDFSLGAEGYEVITAGDGEQAVERSKADRPDLIVMDIMMPKMDGFEACKKIKSNPDTKDIPVIMLTAKGRETDRKRGVDAGADDYVTKPFSPAKLIERVQGVLSATPPGTHRE